MNMGFVFFMTSIKTNRTWIMFCFLLFAPFFFERLFIAPFTLNREPQFIWGAIHWIYCYIAYCVVILIYLKWRKKNETKVILKPEKHEIKWLCLTAAMSLLVKYTFDIVTVYIFSSTVIHFSLPMIYREFLWFLRAEPLWLGVGGFTMQYVYYVFEFALIAFIVDCAQKTSERMGWSQRIPWGGIFLALTWSLMHRFGIILPILRGEYLYSIRTILLCLVIGCSYMLPGKKPTYAFLAVMVWYWF